MNTLRLKQMVATISRTSARRRGTAHVGTDAPREDLQGGPGMKPHHTLAAFTMMLLSAVFVLGALGTPPAHAGDPRPFGTYLLTQADGFLQLLTLTADGNAFSQNSGQFEPAGSFGNQQGKWVITSEHAIQIRTLNFRFDPSCGAFSGFGRSLFTATFDQNGELTGDVVVEIFPPTADPLDLSLANTPSATFGPTVFTGRRLTVH